MTRSTGSNCSSQCGRAGGVMLARFALVLSAATMTSTAIASDPVFLHAAGSLRGALTEVAQRTVALPDELAVGEDYGHTVVNRASPQDYQFAMFILSVDGQRVLARHGFVGRVPVAMTKST